MSMRVIEPFAIGIFTRPSELARECMVRRVEDDGDLRRIELIDLRSGEPIVVSEVPGTPYHEGGWEFE